MNNSTMLAYALQQQPGDKTLALILADALVEDEGLTRAAALRRAAKVRSYPLKAARLIEATALFRANNPARRGLLSAVRKECELSSNTEVTVMVVPSIQWPTAHHTGRSDARRVWAHATVMVGAKWVLTEARALGTANGVQFAHPKRPDHTAASPCPAPRRGKLRLHSQPPTTGEK